MRIISAVLLLVSTLCYSCTKNHDNIVIFKEFEDQEWGRFEYLQGDFNIDKASQKYDVIMEVLVNENYPNIYETHQNDCPLLFNLTIKNPNGSGARSRDYKFMLKDNDGNWKADKKNDCYVFRLPIISEMSFNDKGVYIFKLENKYPKDPLQGIKSVTLKCVNSK